MGMQPSVSSFSMISHHIPRCRILPLNHRGTPAANIRVALFPHLIKEEPQVPTAVPNQQDLGMRVCLNTKMRGSPQGIPFPDSLD